MEVVEQPYSPRLEFWYNQDPASGYYTDYYQRLAETLWSGAAVGCNLHPATGLVRFGPWCAAPQGGGVPRVWAPGTYVTDGVIPISDWEPMLVGLQSKSLKEMLPGIHRESAGLVNDLIELKDWRTLPRTLARLKTAFRSFKDLNKRYTLKQVAKATGDSYLQWSFNIAPVISDILAVGKAMKNVDRQLNWLRRNRNRVLTTHWKQKLQNEFPTVGSQRTQLFRAFMPSWNKISADGIVATRECSYDVREFVGTLQYRFDADLPGGFGDKTKAYGDALGFTLNPAILWNAIPWTFVVDWVFDVSKFLDDFNTFNIEPRTEILQYCYSLHIKRTTKCAIDAGGNFTVKEDAYFRSPALPDYASSIQSSGLSLKEFSLATALGVTRIR